MEIERNECMKMNRDIFSGASGDTNERVVPADHNALVPARPCGLAQTGRVLNESFLFVFLARYVHIVMRRNVALGATIQLAAGARTEFC